MRSQLYQFLVDESTDTEGDFEAFIDCMDHSEKVQQELSTNNAPAISLHALWGTNGCQTMRIVDKIKNSP